MREGRTYEGGSKRRKEKEKGKGKKKVRENARERNAREWNTGRERKDEKREYWNGDRKRRM